MTWYTRDERVEAEKLNQLARLDQWGDYPEGLDVPSAADWLVDCAASGAALENWQGVVDVLTSYVTDCIGADEAAAELRRLLP